MRTNFKRWLFLFLTVAVMVLIFAMSDFSGDESAAQSGSIIEFFVKLFLPDFENLSIEKQLEIISRYQYLVRKCAHFSVFALLGAFSFGFLSTFASLKKRFWVIISFAFSVIYAVSDEWHQTFIPGRAGVFTDVLYDSSGAAVGILVSLIILYCVRNRSAGDKFRNW